MSQSLVVTKNNDHAPSGEEQSLWKQLDREKDLTKWCSFWLRLLCQSVDPECCAVLFDASQGDLKPAVSWPTAMADQDFLAVAEAARRNQKGIVTQPDGEGGRYVLAYPIMIADMVKSVVVVMLETPKKKIADHLNEIQKHCFALRERMWRQMLQDDVQQNERASETLQLLISALENKDFMPACRAIVTEIATRFALERVSIGFLHKGNVRCAAISHSAQFGKQMNLVQHLNDAMNEAVDQSRAVTFPSPDDEVTICRAHTELAKAFGTEAIVTVPLFAYGEFIGALSCEAAKRDDLTPDTLDIIDALATAIAPLLADKQRNDRWIGQKLFDSAAEQLKRLFGPAHILYKLTALFLLVAGILAMSVKGAYTITADAQVEGRLLRSIVTPMNGFLLEAHVRAGDTVEAGQVVARLDSRDLVLEKSRWLTERQRKVFEYEKSLGDRNRTEQKIATTLIEQAEAQIRLADEQLARSELIAPFAGIVVSGDQSQSIGAAVQRGQILFEIAPSDSYRIALDVDESQIADIFLGQAAKLVVTSYPNEQFNLKLVKITPISRAAEGKNTFRIEGELDVHTNLLRPGMKGVAKIDGGRRLIVAVWTRSFVNWVKLSLWRWTA